jgi:hypothetical protein
LLTRRGGVVVAGATGALRPAVRALVDQDRTVYALARPGPGLTALQAELCGAVRAIAVDYLDVTALRAALAEHLPAGAQGALLYCPGAPLEAVQLLAATADRPVVLSTSAAADPALVGDAVPDPARLPGPSGAVRLLLGWAQGPDGTSCWHTPEEISAAALTSLGDGRSQTLGVVRPWTQRPSA